MMWSGDISSLPFGWALCDGRWSNPEDNTDRATTSSGTRTFKTPDLRGRFIAGYDPEYDGANNAYDNPGNYSTGGTSTGDMDGLASVTLTTAQIPAHTHTMNSAGNHGHTITVTSGGTHDHELTISRRYNQIPDNVNGPGLFFTSGPDVDVDDIDYVTSYTRGNIGDDGSHTHTASASTASAHTHTITSSGGSGGSHENRPPFYVLAFIIKL